ncbi:MAG: hypothetical protein Q9M50_08905 [Methylococcales bacterium]|nr:hypothetical protein [Methylococcales bacterium]
MPNLDYCHLKVFGSDFQAKNFSDDMNILNAKILYREKNYPRSPVTALKLGRVSTWKTPKAYFSHDGVTNPFKIYLNEERFMLNFLKKFYELQKILLPYKNETVEIYFSAIYTASVEEKSTGVYFGVELIEALCKLEASISTEVIFE